MRSEIATNLNVLEFVKIFDEICKTLGVRWSNRYGVTAPFLDGNPRMTFMLYYADLFMDTTGLLSDMLQQKVHLSCGIML